MSTHECPVVRIDMKPHPDADSLSLMEILGWEVCLRTEDWTNGQLAVYIPPDFVIPTEGPYAELFAWLKTDSNNWNRIRTRKFRGRYSHGILIPSPENFSEGDDAMESMGIKRYEPPLPLSAGGDNETGPKVFSHIYDVENIQRFRECLPSGTEVLITEKLHGANSRFIFTEDRMWAGSHRHWKAPSDKNLWWQALKQNSWIEPWCKANPGYMLYGEVFGQVGKFGYGSQPGQLFFRVFDILDKDRWMEVGEIAQKDWAIELQWVPTLYRGPFNEEMALELALGNSSLPNAKHMREGVVIRCVPEKHHPELGRIQLKLVSPKYLARR